jgi:hypothetical protein
MSQGARPSHEKIFSDVETIWKSYVDAVEQSLERLQQEIEKAGNDSQVCTEQWCMDTDQMLKEFVHILYSMYVPSFVSREYGRKLEVLKRKVHDLYTRFLTISSTQARPR